MEDLRGSGVAVAVIDSGVTRSRASPTSIPAATTSTRSANGLVDCDGHGTAVAGIIAGQPGPDGFFGVAPRGLTGIDPAEASAQWSPKLPAGGGDPRRDQDRRRCRHLGRAVRHAADIPLVRVINISLIDCIAQYKQVDQVALGAALRYAAIDKDIVVVAAAGNTGRTTAKATP